MPNYDLPSRVDKDQLLKVIRGYYAKRAHEDPVSTVDVEEVTQMTDKVGRQTKFLHDVGIIESRGQSRALTERGEELAQALNSENEAVAKAHLRELLSEWEPTEDLLAFVRMQEATRKDILEYLAPEGTSRDDRGLNALFDLYVWSGLLDETEEGIYEAPTDAPSPSELQSNTASGRDSSAQTEESGADDSTDDIRSPGSVEQSSSGNLVIKLEISPDHSTNEIEETILAARRALEADLTEEDS